jgi:peptidyl-prolyl cis-trans isomerase C
LILTACAVADVPPPTATPAVLPTDTAGLELVASVNGQGIRLDAFERELARYQQQTNETNNQALRAIVLDTLIEQTLIDQEAARQGIGIDEAQIDAEVAAIAQMAGSAEGWQQWLTDNLYTEAEFRSSLRTTLITARMRDVITADLGGEVLHVRARHILVDSEQEANSILDQLRNGADFAALAALSKDTTTRDSGGDLGWFTQDELVDPALATVAFSLEPLQIAGPVRTSLGFHVIQTLERANRPVDEERRALLAQRQFELWLGALAASAQIERYL